MSFYVAKNSEEFDAVMSPETLVKAAPDYYGPRLDAIKDLRDADDGTGYKGQEFRKVASFVNVPLLLAVKMSDPTFLRDKKRFYSFIDKHREYCTYDRRNRGRGTAKDALGLPLSVLGIDYPGAPKTIENWDAVEVEPEVLGDTPTETPIPNTEDNA